MDGYHDHACNNCKKLKYKGPCIAQKSAIASGLLIANPLVIQDCMLHPMCRNDHMHQKERGKKVMGKECILSFRIQRNLLGRYFSDNDRIRISGEREGRIIKKGFQDLEQRCGSTSHLLKFSCIVRSL